MLPESQKNPHKTALMTLEKLSNQESKIAGILESLSGNIDDDHQKILDAEINDVFQQYSILSDCNIEALKRGLFMIWFQVSEPGFLTGIIELNKFSKERIINSIEKKITQSQIDYELSWMLTYYKDWDYIFEEFKSNYSFYNLLKNSETERPKIIDIKAMSQRGMMGRYWNSIYK